MLFQIFWRLPTGKHLMQQPAGIPTGAYQLLRIATPLDPEPRGPVYDGGLLVAEGLPAVIEASPARQFRVDDAQGASGDASSRTEATTPDELRNKYLFIDLRKESVALLTLPERHSRGDLLIECQQVRSNRGLATPLSQETLSRLMEDRRFRDPVYSSTDVRVCGLVPGTAGMMKVPMDRVLAQRGIRLPSIEDLVAACTIHYATTGRHLVPLGRTVRAADGIVKTALNGGQLRVVLDSVDEYANDPWLVAAGWVPPGAKSVGSRRQDGFFGRIARLAGL